MKDRALEKEVVAMRQRIAELEAMAQENAQRYDGAQQGIAERTIALTEANAQLQQEIAERKRAEEEAQRRAVQAALIYEVGQRVSGELELDELFSAIVTAIFDAFGYYSVTLAPVDEEAGCLTIGAIAGGYADILPQDSRIVIGEGMTGYAAATGETQISGDVSQNPHFVRLADEETKSELVVPIESGQRIIGVLDLQSEEFDAFDQTDVMLMETLADQIAVAIENARLFDQAQREIAERKRLEEEIHRQKDYFEALFINNPVAVVTVDLVDANVVAWNPAAEKLFGYTQEEAIGQNVDDLVASDDSIRMEAVEYTDQVLIERQERVQATTKRTRKDGSMVDVEMLGVPVIVAEEMVGFIVIYHDINELQEARRAAEAANQAKFIFLANMSHELRTPLNAILGFTQLMDRDPNLTAEQKENLGIISRSGEHLLALINDVLEMSKIEAGQVTLQETSFDLYHLLDGLEEMFDLRAKDKGLTLSFERAENVPQYVRTDEGKLRQILSNLLGNAVKFTQKGSVALRVATLPGLEKKGTLHFEVEDTGPGIAPEDLTKVFDPFVQATNGHDLVSTQHQEGTGLGLSISRQFVRLMGGDITTSSELGLGSLFAFDVQVGLVEATEVQAELPTRQVIGLEPGQVAYRLLVVENKETNRQLLVKLLKPLGFEVQEAVNGQEAIEVWERWEPHLIWMDIRMPVIDGYEATRRIKATTKGRDTVIIALTASAFEEDRERVLSEGCDDFVRKPFREDEIFDVLAKHLGVRFIFDKEHAQLTAALTIDVAASLTAALAILPSDWVADLQQATIKADLNLILTLIDQIRGKNPVLANALVDLANDFEYKKILTLIEQVGA